MNFLLNETVLNVILETFNKDFLKNQDFTNMNEYAKTIKDKMGIKFSDYLMSYNSSSNKNKQLTIQFINNLVVNLQSPGAEELINLFLLEKNKAMYGYLLSNLIYGSLKTPYRETELLIMKIVETDKKDKIWTDLEKTYFTTSNTRVQLLLNNQFYKIDESYLKDILETDRIFSIFDTLKNMINNGKKDEIPQNIWHAIPFVGNEFKEKIQDFAVLDECFSYFHQNYGDKVLFSVNYRFDNYNSATISKDINIDNNKFFSEGLYPSIITLYSPKASSLYVEKIMQEWENAEIRQDSAKMRLLTHSMNFWLNTYSESIPKDNKNEHLLPILDFMKNENSKNIGVSMIDIFNLFPKEEDSAFYSKEVLAERYQTVKNLFIDVLENEKKFGLKSYDDLNYHSNYLGIVKAIAFDSSIDVINPFIEENMKKIVSNRSSHKADAQFLNQLSELPSDNIVLLLKDENRDLTFDINNKIISFLKMEMSLPCEYSGPIMKLAFTIDPILERMKTEKVGSSSFFKHCLKSKTHSENFIKEIKRNFNNPIVKSFLNDKKFVKYMSSSSTVGVPELLMEMVLKEKMKVKIKDEKSNVLFSNVFKL